MEIRQPKKIGLKNILIRSLKLPILLLILGVALSALVCLEPFCHPTNFWGTMIRLANAFGAALMTLSWVLFLYLAIINILREYEKISQNEHHKTASHILATIRKGSRIIFVFLALYVVSEVIEFKYQYPNIFDKITAVFLIASFAWLILQIISTLEMISYYKYASVSKPQELRSSGYNYTKIRQIKNIASILVVVIAVSATLMLFDQVRNIGISILASATFLTAILAFSAQRTLGSMFAGVQLAFSKRIQIGDAITIENEQGIVEEITLTYVVIKIADAGRLILPVSYFLEKPIYNWSLNNFQLQGSIKFYLDYLFPVDALRQELNKLLTTSRYWNQKVGTLTVSNIKENTIEVRIGISANSLDDLDHLKAELREKLLHFISSHYPDFLPKVRINRNLSQQ